MVTISICENGRSITSLMQNCLAPKGYSVNMGKVNSESDYVFLTDDSRKACDILLLHDSKDICIRADYVTLMNADKNWEGHNAGNSLLITYGLNPLATVTASSFPGESEKNRFFCCIQRSFVTLKGKIIEPCEFPVVLPDGVSDISATMAYVSLALLLSVSPEELGKISPSP